MSQTLELLAARSQEWDWHSHVSQWATVKPLSSFQWPPVYSIWDVLRCSEPKQDQAPQLAAMVRPWFSFVFR